MTDQQVIASDFSSATDVAAADPRSRIARVFAQALTWLRDRAENQPTADEDDIELQKW